jgi:GH25 family lysozyme M1 (1,4-beta-N-acetylmuramidase)
MSVTMSRPRHAMLPVIVVLAMLSAVLLFAVVSLSRPDTALGYTYRTETPVCDGVYLRTKATKSSPKKVSISRGAKVYVVGTVNGGSWKRTCGGAVRRGSVWVRITQVNGRTVRSLYGVSYLYAPSGLFKNVAVTKEAACDGVSLRSSGSTKATRKALIDAGTRVTVVAAVSGGSWSATCAGNSVSGSSWWRIKAIDGTSVNSLFGVSYVYAATKLFNKVSSTAPAPTPAPTPNPTPTPPPGTTLTEGIDVSHWQGTIDWTKVKAAGKKFVFMKASEGTSFVDNKYATNRSSAKANGILVGAYHFAQPSTSTTNAVAQADHFIDTAKPVKGELLPVLDLEVTNDIGTTALVNWTKAFLQRVYERTGVRAAIYVSPSFWSNKMGNTNWFANNGYKVLWIAHWTTGSSPTVPADNWGSQGWTFWQYTSDGSVSGISGRVDLNRYRGTDFTKVLIP